MRNFKINILVGATLAFAVTAMAQLEAPINAFSSGSTNAHGTLSHTIISARSGNGGAPAIQYVNAGSDKVGATLRFSKITAQLQATYTNSTTTLFVNNTNSSSANWQAGTVIIRHVLNDQYEKRTLAANTGSTNIVLSTATLQAVVPGDIIYYATTNSPTIVWGPAAVTNSLNAAGAPIYVGQQGKPLLVEIDATTAGGVFLVSGQYVPPAR